jgi:UDP-N-acetylglucosamine/UDP-N-acetylgalactosamine diphosphorylase
MTAGTSDYETQRKRYEAAGQGHVFQYYDKLSEVEKVSLVASAAAIDVDRAIRVFKQSTSEASREHDDDPISPLPEEAFESTVGEEYAQRAKEWREVGLWAIAENKVGVLLMAGGQGTRLGSSDPKGCYDIGLPSHKPLFQIQAERITRLQYVAEQQLDKPKGSVVIPWYIMTSGPTRPATETFFQKHDFFGLKKSNVIIFEQGE